MKACAQKVLSVLVLTHTEAVYTDPATAMKLPGGDAKGN